MATAESGAAGHRFGPSAELRAEGLTSHPAQFLANHPHLKDRIFARTAKRAFDLVIATFLLVLALPLMLLIAVAIKLESRGPAFFRSPRVGRNGEPFGMLKFRTMVDRAHGQRDVLRHMNDAPHGVFKIQDDPRLTRLGRWLRLISIDEFPQLLQVLTGKMSLVGPRPLPPEEDALIPPYAERREIRPGVTGPWQVAGSWRIPLEEMLELERHYLQDWSLSLDALLLLKTVPYVLRGRGV